MRTIRDTSFDVTVILDPETGEPIPAGAFERAWGAVLNALLRAADRVYYVMAPPIDRMTFEQQAQNEARFLAGVAALILALSLLFIGFSLYVGSKA